MRGVDRNHYDSNSQAGIAKSGANTVRMFADTDYGESVAGLVNIVQTQHITEKEVPIPTSSSTAAGTATSCSTDTAVLSSVVASWVSAASSWTPLDKYQIINIANEWGPANSTVWRDSYIAAIASMRSAGYLGTLLIDAGGCGQDLADLVTYSGAVFQSDPQLNIMFALHLYGSVNDYTAPISGIQKGNPTVVTLTSTSLCHPFAPSYCPTVGGMTNTYSGLTAYQLSGVAGMTQINGMQPAPQNVGGSSGAWTVTLTSTAPISAPTPAEAPSSTTTETMRFSSHGSRRSALPRARRTPSPSSALAATSDRVRRWRPRSRSSARPKQATSAGWPGRGTTTTSPTLRRTTNGSG